MLRNSCFRGGLATGSLASSESGGLAQASAPRRRMRPKRRGSVYAIAAPSLMTISSFVKRGGHTSMSMVKFLYCGASTPWTTTDPVMPRWIRRLLVAGPVVASPSSSQSCFPFLWAERMKAPSSAAASWPAVTPSAITLSSNSPSRGPPPCSVTTTALIREPTARSCSSRRCASTSGSSGIGRAFA
eukprot:scaffold134387_cov31-Tisochrysis_lutea.AAC.1